ncbi:leucine-rich repeat-containing protein 14-like [Anneissia japonica]|uniref:leucine-rich repeat-containing protein 14-like n=1 Tax=Anneissia japonica TaxID=1529436 RepID=UPI0014255580|nr:leucine-rich repeat-containing protein 14-like [Anneissia japonica]XP_033107974.1 leucine-rich repeat-containing protein 14-like [Anneissia japonica]
MKEMMVMTGSEMRFKSLVHICASKITSNYQMTKEAVSSVPHELFQILLAVAVSNNQAPATKLLVSRWPYKVLNLCNVLTSDTQLQFSLADITTQIMVTVLSAVVGTSSCQAKVVDLQGVRLRCVDMATCLHAMINAFKTSSNPTSDKVKVIFDWTVEEQNFHIVSKAMNTFSESCKVELQCGKMKAEGLSENRLIRLIGFLDKDIAHGLNLSLNSLSHSGLKMVLPHIKRLENLRSVDLSYNILNLPRDISGDVCKCIKEVFSSLPRLQDISLGYNRITGRLMEIMNSLQSPVRSLRLDKCFLSLGDLSYMSNTMNTSHLKMLDLSGNTLSNYIKSLENVLLRSCHSLVQLNLDGTSLANNDLSSNMLKRTAASFKKLAKFSIQYNGFVSVEQIGIVTAYASIPTLRLIRITVQASSEVIYGNEFLEDVLLGGNRFSVLSEYQEALDQLPGDKSRVLTLEVRDELTGCLFVDALTFRL